MNLPTSLLILGISELEMDGMNANETQQTLGPFIVGEHFLLTITLAKIRERHAADSPIGAKLEVWAKENIPILIKQENSSGDLVAALKDRTSYLQAELSQKEARRAQAERATGVEANKRAIQKALQTGDIKGALEKKVFYLLNWERYHDLKHPDIQRLINVARKTHDKRLLIRLGRALTTKPKSGPDDLFVDKLSFVLIEGWTKGPESQVELCRLTDEALTEFCNLALTRNNLSLATVRKIRQRLGLKKGPKPWLKTVRKTGEGIVVSP